MSDLVSLTCPSLQIMGKTQTGISYFRISDQSLIKVNCHNFRTSDDTDMKLGPVTTLANSQLSASCIPDAWSIKPLMIFSLTKTENRTKNLWNISHTICLSKGTIFAKNADFLLKKSKTNTLKAHPKVKEWVALTTFSLFLFCYFSLQRLIFFFVLHYHYYF